MTLVIKPIAAKGRDLHDFIGLPDRIYAGIAGYVPSLRLERNMMLHPKKAVFFKRGRAQYWLALRDGVPVGRISAQIDPHLPLGLPAGTGLFGAIDAIDDPAVVQALCDAAETWLGAQGCSYAFGPCLLDINSEPGLMVAGQDEPPMIMTAWHPAYLQAHIAAAGYGPLRDLFAWRLPFDPSSLAALKPLVALARRRPDIKMRHPTLATIFKDTAILRDLYNDAWSDNWGFVPLSKPELDHMIRLLWLYQPFDMTKIVEVNGEPVCAMMTVPNTTELSRGLPFDLSLLGWLRLGWRSLFYRHKSARIILFGMHRPLRGTALGGAISMMLIDDLINQQTRRKTDYVEAGWVLENNQALNSILERFGFYRAKTFRLFGKSITPIPSQEIAE